MKTLSFGGLHPRASVKIERLSQMVKGILPNTAKPVAARADVPALSPVDVLSVKNGLFYLGGRPFAEVSFNKFDLFWLLWDQLRQGKLLNAQNPVYVAQNLALKQLNQLGFSCIRLFVLPPANCHGIWRDQWQTPNGRRLFFLALDTVFALCDRHHIKVVCNLGVLDFTDTHGLLQPGGAEHPQDLVENPHSQSRQRLYHYLDTLVARYKSRPSILYWELCNKGNLQADIPDDSPLHKGIRPFSLPALGRFFGDLVKRIKQQDPLRLVASGGVALRPQQWHLWQRKGWQCDTPKQQLEALEMLYKNAGLDILDWHFYDFREGGLRLQDEQQQPALLDIKAVQQLAQRLHLPLVLGECAALPDAKVPGYFADYADEPAAKIWVQQALDTIALHKIPLSFWWSYQDDRPRKSGRVRTDLALAHHPELVRLIAESNRKLKHQLANALSFRDIENFSTMADWVGDANAQCVAERGLGKIKVNLKQAWCCAQRSVAYNLDDFPLFEISVHELSPGASWRLSVFDGTLHNLQLDGSSAGVFEFNLKQITQWKGHTKFDVLLFVAGGKGKQVAFEYLRIKAPQ
jgi:hypothetical protein